VGNLLPSRWPDFPAPGSAPGGTSPEKTPPHKVAAPTAPRGLFSWLGALVSFNFLFFFPGWRVVRPGPFPAGKIDRVVDPTPKWPKETKGLPLPPPKRPPRGSSPPLVPWATKRQPISGPKSPSLQLKNWRRLFSFFQDGPSKLLARAPTPMQQGFLRSSE